MSYCKNCGKQLIEGAVACTVCGCPVGVGANHCDACGEKLVPGSAYCVHCGHAVVPSVMVQSKPPRSCSRYAAAAFGIVMGAFGVHSFYLGNAGKGLGQIAVALAAYCLVMLNVLPGFAGALLAGLWGFIEGVLILVGDIKTDEEGNPLRQWGDDA